MDYIRLPSAALEQCVHRDGDRHPRRSDLPAAGIVGRTGRYASSSARVADQYAAAVNRGRRVPVDGPRVGGASPEESRAAGRNLIERQRSDGGWPQLPRYDSDAYSTGEALYALR